MNASMLTRITFDGPLQCILTKDLCSVSSLDPKEYVVGCSIRKRLSTTPEIQQGEFELIFTTTKCDPQTVHEETLTVSMPWIIDRCYINDADDYDTTIPSIFNTKSTSVDIKGDYCMLPQVCADGASRVDINLPDNEDEDEERIPLSITTYHDSIVCIVSSHKTLSVHGNGQSHIVGGIEGATVQRLHLQLNDTSNCVKFKVIESMTGDLLDFSSAEVFIVADQTEDQLEASGFSKKRIRNLRKVLKEPIIITEGGESLPPIISLDLEALEAKSVLKRKRPNTPPTTTSKQNNKTTPTPRLSWDHTSRDSKSTSIKASPLECKICLTNRVSTVNKPCGHVVTCYSCTKIQKECYTNQINKWRCALCRAPIQSADRFIL